MWNVYDCKTTFWQVSMAPHRPANATVWSKLSTTRKAPLRSSCSPHVPVAWASTSLRPTGSSCLMPPGTRATTAKLFAVFSVTDRPGRASCIAWSWTTQLRGRFTKDRYDFYCNCLDFFRSEGKTDFRKHGLIWFLHEMVNHLSVSWMRLIIIISELSFLMSLINHPNRRCLWISLQDQISAISDISNVIYAVFFKLTFASKLGVTISRYFIHVDVFHDDKQSRQYFCYFLYKMFYLLIQ